MKEFLAPKGGLAALQPSTRLALALFLVFALLGYGVMIALGVARSGLDVTSIREYYGGSTPELAKSTGELLELTHFHLFAMPMQLFVLGHVFLLGRYSQRWRRWIVVAAFAGAACDLAAPWLVQAAGESGAWVKLAGRLLLAPSLMLMILVPLLELLRLSSGPAPATPPQGQGDARTGSS